MASKSPAIHQTAIVSPKAEIAAGVEVGPYSVIGEGVEIGEGTRVGPHTVIEGPAVIGRENHFIGQAAIGTIPQDLKYRGEKSRLVMGDRNTVREFVTINRGTAEDRGRTTIGSGNLLMTGVHVAHDSDVGSGVILANSASLAGHVVVEDFATLSAFAGVHQKCRVGTYAFVGAYTVLTRDALPFIKTVGQRNQARIYGINQVGLARRGFTPEQIDSLRKAYRWLFQKGLRLKQAVGEIHVSGIETDEVRQLIQFMENSSRGFVRRVSRIEEGSELL